jgi:tRNA(Ile)-lysidine synthase
MNKVLAVSGGVDSMVMLDLMRKQFPARELVVATFDHGTRESSKTDAEFVKNTAKRLRIKCYVGTANLGPDTDEDTARQKRYTFLRQIADRARGEIFTAHHLDDLIESVTINLTRGTGPRGLAVLNADKIHRPFIDGSFDEPWDKCKILKYAAKNKISFRQDPTNTSDVYLRNRLRERLKQIPTETKQKVFELWQKQKEIYQEIDNTISEILPEDSKYRRDWFYEIDEQVALELIRAALLRVNISATRPQIFDFYKAILEYAPSKKFNLPDDNLVLLRKKDFQLKVC